MLLMVTNSQRIFWGLSKNVIYISPDIQNKIIKIINFLIVKKFVDKIIRSKCFTISADEMII